MSLPTDSVAPAPPTGSSNPWSLVQWWKRICDWIAALSPSGADEYDTGWQDLEPDTGFTPSLLGIRRIGRRVYLRGAVIRDAGNWPGASPVLTIPSGYRPAQWHQQSITGPTSATAYGLGVTISAAGVLSVYRLGTAQFATAYLDGVSYLVD